MTLPSSPPLSLSQIKAEFGGSNNLSDYHAGGPYVPSGTTGVNGPVPSSGPLKISDFLGTSDLLQQITMGVGNGGTANALFGYSSETSPTFGSLSNTAFFAGGDVEDFWWNSSNNDIALAVTAGGIPQDAFATVTINGHTYNSADASYIDGGSFTVWNWSGSNPFGTSGSITCTFN